MVAHNHIIHSDFRTYPLRCFCPKAIQDGPFLRPLVEGVIENLSSAIHVCGVSLARVSFRDLDVDSLRGHIGEAQNVTLTKWPTASLKDNHILWLFKLQLSS